jgi:hypothetical protein
MAATIVALVEPAAQLLNETCSLTCQVVASWAAVSLLVRRAPLKRDLQRGRRGQRGAASMHAQVMGHALEVHLMLVYPVRTPDTGSGRG